MKNISQGFNFAKFEKIREIRENLYPQKFVPLKYKQGYLLNILE